MYRKRIGDRLEDLGAFKRRRYCDRACMAQGMHREQVTKGAHLARARRHKKDACEECGTAVGLHVHHEDNDWRNDDLTNLRTLCGSCHLKHHWATDDRRSETRRRRAVRLDALEALYVLAEEMTPLLPVADQDRLAEVIRQIKGAKG